jgi:hypothetical protein
MDNDQPRISEDQAGKLTDWIKEPTIQDLKLDLDAAKPAHDAQISKIDEWNDLMQVRNAAKPATVKGRSSVQPKLVRRQAEWRYSALSEPFLSSNTLFKVEPVTWEDADKARQNALLLNWQFRTKLNRVSFVDNFVRSTVDDGTSIVRVGWKRVTIPIKKQVPVWTHFQIQDPNDAQRLQQAIEAKQENPNGFEDSAPPDIKEAVQLYEEQGIPTVAHQTGVQEVDDEKVLENKPTVEVLDPRNVFIDPSCNGDLTKANYAVISFETCQADLLKEPQKYDQEALKRVNWASNSPANEPNHASNTPPDFALQDELRRKVVAYEYWGFRDIDGSGTLQPIVATWIGDTMIRMQPNPYPDECIPLVLVPYLPIKRDLYGETDAELLGDNQKILGALTRGMIDLLGRSANGQQGLAKGMLDALNRKRYDNGQDYEFNQGITPANGIIEHKFPELPQSAILMTQMVNEDAEALTGVKSFSGGLSGQAYGDVASGIRSMLDAASKREMAILRRLAKGMTQIGEKIIAMNSVFLSEQETVRLTNKQFEKINREDLKGNFDLDTDISTAEVDNAKAQDLAFMLQTCGPATGPEIVMMIMSEIADLKRMPELAQKLRTFKPQVSPEQQQLQALQLQQAQLQVTLLQSEIQLNQAKAASEKAKGDKTNLDYVEQETGTTHARDMQKMEAQGLANQNLEVTKAIVAPLKEGQKRPDVKPAIGFNAISGALGHSQLNSV